MFDNALQRALMTDQSEPFATRDSGASFSFATRPTTKGSNTYTQGDCQTCSGTCTSPVLERRSGLQGVQDTI
eukprot:12903968-Prorocentrum_lima.AAC.1